MRPHPGSRPPVLLASSSDWVAATRLPRVLRQAGCEVHVMTSKRWGLAQSRHVARVHDAPEELPRFVDALRAHLQRPDTDYRWILVIDDPLLAALTAEAREGRGTWLRPWFPIDPNSDKVGVLASQIGFARAATEAELPVPAWRVCTDLGSLAAAAENLGFPLVLKRSQSYGGLGVRVVQRADELGEAYLAVGAGEILVQQFVPGPIGNIVVLFDHGRPICWMCAFKVRTFPGPYGPSCARQFTGHADVETILGRLGRWTGLHGFAAVDWVMERHSNRLVLIELNGRPVPTIHMGNAAGVDFARAIRSMLNGTPEVQRPPARPPHPGIFPMFPEDLYRALTEKDWRSLTTWLPGFAGWRDVPWDDPRIIAYHATHAHGGWVRLRRDREREDQATEANEPFEKKPG